MRFSGTKDKMQAMFQLLISLYGADATILDVQRSVAIVRK